MFFQNTTVSIQLGKIQILGSHTKTYTVQLTHGRERQIWHVELHCDSRQVKSNSCFLTFQTNNPNNRDNRPPIQPSLSPTRGITQIFAIFEPFSHLYHKFSCRNTLNNPNIWDRTPTIQNFSNNTEYTLQLQASTQPTMLRTVLDHNPSAFPTV